MKYRKWYNINIRIDEQYQDLLIGQLALLGFNGFLQEEKNLGCYILYQQWTHSNRLKFTSLLDRFKNEFPFLELYYKIKSIREKNWNRIWEKQTNIVEVSRRIIVKPSWKKLPARYRNKLVLHIDPKMSFGTGHHETTRLSLYLIEQFFRPGGTVLDFGCGTGILAIACVKLGAKSVVAVDNDKWAVENTQENMRRNSIRNKMSIRHGSTRAIPHRIYDMSIANIDIATISQSMNTLSTLTKKNGIMILSGLIAHDMRKLLPSFKKYSLMPIELVYENEWIAVALLHI